MGAQCRIGFQPVPDATKADRFCLHSPAAMQRDGHISLSPAPKATRRIRWLFTSLPFGTGWKPIPLYGAMGAQCRIGFQPVPDATKADRFCLHSPAAIRTDDRTVLPASTRCNSAHAMADCLASIRDRLEAYPTFS